MHAGEAPEINQAWLRVLQRGLSRAFGLFAFSFSLPLATAQTGSAPICGAELTTDLQKLEAIVAANRATWQCGKFTNIYKMNRGARIFDEHFGVRTLPTSALVRRYLMIRNGQAFLSGSGRPLTTSRARAVMRFGPNYILAPDYWMFVMYSNGVILLSPNGSTVTKHSSMAQFGRAEIASAGQIKIVKGKIVFITNQSGHYFPNDVGLAQFLFQLKCLGADLSALQAFIIGRP